MRLRIVVGTKTLRRTPSSFLPKVTVTWIASTSPNWITSILVEITSYLVIDFGPKYLISCAIRWVKGSKALLIDNIN